MPPPPPPPAGRVTNQTPAGRGLRVVHMPRSLCTATAVHILRRNRVSEYPTCPRRPSFAAPWLPQPSPPPRPAPAAGGNCPNGPRRMYSRENDRMCGVLISAGRLSEAVARRWWSLGLPELGSTLFVVPVAGSSSGAHLCDLMVFKAPLSLLGVQTPIGPLLLLRVRQSAS